MSDDAERLADELTRARARVSDLEGLVARQRAEIGDLRLQLDVLATMDPLSGLPNLAGIVDLVDAAGRRLDRTGEPFGVMAIDVPGLGDADVRQAGSVLAAALRRIDRPGWAGGGGFVVVMPGLTAPGASMVVARVTGAVDGVLQRPTPTRMALVLCGRPPAPEAFRVVDRARRLVGGAATGAPVIEDYSGPLDW